VVVTVSEETGKINICYGGVFHYMENEEVLRRYLRKFLIDIDRVGVESAQGRGL
jgi:hypothetical protein